MDAECNNERNFDLEELQLEYAKLESYTKLLEMANDIAQSLNKALREDNETLRIRLKNAVELD